MTQNEAAHFHFYCIPSGAWSIVDIGMGIMLTNFSKITIPELRYNYIKERNLNGKKISVDFAVFGQKHKIEFPFYL